MAKYAKLTHTKKYNVAKLKKVIRDVKKLSKTEIVWGWINGKTYNASDTHGRKGIPYALVAIRNEFGGYTKNAVTGKYVYIPSRPYFQQSTKASINSTAKGSREVIDLVLSGQSYTEKLKEIGGEQVDIVKKSVAQNNMKPLHKKTIAMKDSSKQWYDTGAMMKNLTFKVTYKRAGTKGV